LADFGKYGQAAQQGARANVHIGHASCYPILLRSESSDRVFELGTSHARCGRGSSLTFGKGYVICRQLKCTTSCFHRVCPRGLLLSARRELTSRRRCTIQLTFSCVR
jgi:hypothetical protein